MEQEIKRKIIHISMGFLALLLAIFPRWLSILTVLIALFFVLVIARPEVWKTGFEAMASRTEDKRSGFLQGPTLYVFMVFLLVIFLDLRVAASCFAIMAFGDGFANVIGTRYGKHRFSQFHNKSLEGVIAFVFFSFISSVLAFFLVSLNVFDISPWISILDIKPVNGITTSYVIVILLSTSIIASITELLSGGILNDNITVPIVTGMILTIFLKF
ncbi:MAG: diacylglycerol/polyprenol kinase family protein [Candidatus Hodarchaeales archaeon]|jgi:dolichol kinase